MIQPLPPRLQKIKNVLVCPTCKISLILLGSCFNCDKCSGTYPIRDGKIFFVQVPIITDNLDYIKNKLKKLLGKLYYSIGITLIAPTYPFNFKKEVQRHVGITTDKIIIDVGCGGNRLDSNLIGMDMFPYAAVDIICDIKNMPFKNESIDSFISRSVLEHVAELQEAISEIQRCSKKNSIGIHSIPFLYPYHASPHDYQRFTHSGASKLFKNWQIIEQKETTGPITLFLLCIIEFLSIIFSFNIKRIQPVMYLFFCIILFPIKFLDFFFIGNKTFISLAPSIMTVLKKIK